MILEEDGYMLDPSKLGKMEFPFYNEFGRCGYYLPADKSVYIPVRFKFSGSNLCASVSLTDGSIVKAKAKIDIHSLFQTMKDAYEKDASLFEQSYLKKYMRLLADAVYNQLEDASDDLLLQDQEHKFPAFLFQRGRLIAISKCMKFSLEEDGRLGMTMVGAKGSFLRSFQAEEDMETSLVMLNAVGENVLLSAGTIVGKVNCNEISMTKEKDRMPKKDLASKCIGIYQQYKENLMNYFLDKEEALEGGIDFGFEELFQADE